MVLKLTKHFQERMIERGINLDHVKQAIKDPDSKEEAYEGAIKVQKEFGSKTIEVIYSKEAFRDRREHYLLITAYYL